VTFSRMRPRTWKLTFEYEYSVPGVKWKLLVRSRACGASCRIENLSSGFAPQSVVLRSVSVEDNAHGASMRIYIAQ
jgi:hypothetical protein